MWPSSKQVPDAENPAYLMVFPKWGHEHTSHPGQSSWHSHFPWIILENTGSLSNFIFQTSMHFITSKYHKITSEKFYKKKKKSISTLVSSRWQIEVFQNSHFCLKGQILSLTITAVKCLEVTGSCGSFPRKCLPNNQVWMMVICRLVSHEKWVLPDKCS